MVPNYHQGSGRGKTQILLFAHVEALHTPYFNRGQIIDIVHKNLKLADNETVFEMQGARSPSWKVFWERGMELVRLSNYADSLVQFDKAASRNSDEKVIFESRAVVLEKLGRDDEALRDSKRVVDLAPASYKGYARSSQILFKTRKLRASLKMANLALERINQCDQSQRDEILRLKGQILDYLRKATSPASHFSKLPFEIASIIFAFGAGEDVSDAISISHVCKGWRAMALNTTALWKSVVLRHNRDIRKAGVFLKRANGRIDRLEIHSDFGLYQKNFFDRHALDSFWPQLGTLALINVRQFVWDFIPWEKLRLKTFILTSMAYFWPIGNFWEDLNCMTFRTISSVTFTGSVGPSSHLQRYCSLTRLQICSTRFGLQYSQLTSVFYNNPGLITVIIDSHITELTEIQLPTNKVPFAMASLVHFENHQYGAWLRNLLNGAFSFPALQTLHLYERMFLGDYLFLFEPFATNIVALRLSSDECPTAMLISFLQAAHNLITLDLFDLGRDLSNEMDALAGRNQSLICSKLEHVHFRSCSMLSSMSLVNLAESRLSHASEDKGGAPLADTSAVEHRRSESPYNSTYDGIVGGATVMPIKSLVIERCGLIDPDTIRRLRMMVKRVRYIPSNSFTTKTPQAPKLKPWR
ncbi:hypothetical protein BD410DRAFT_275405 [Rickenella mellea]|uniref:F-box domain-containing protein n=1 Tax=Rickenella mellea TaxID=50990 RepID=A0A4Y7Q479_9AGAM|nr:hypothetical protein BD410DRAFT_275405 [Rickenella mellea]